MRVLLTGGSGFIGGHIARALSADGHEIRLLVRPTSDTSFVDDLQFERVVGDLRQADSLIAACRGVDVVVHAAAVLRAANSDDFMSANRAGTASLAQAASAAGVGRFVYISSLAAQGPSLGGTPEAPDIVPHPMTAYGRSKLAGEDEVINHRGGMRVSILRPPLVYGPADRGLLGFFWLAQRGFCVRLGDGTNRISAIYGPDLADAVVAIIGADSRAELPLISRHHVSDRAGFYDWNQLLASLGAVAGGRLRIVSLPGSCFHGLAKGSEWLSLLTKREPMLDRARVTEMRQPAWLCDPTSLTRDTGWQAQTSIEDGMRATMSWYQEHGWV